MRLDHIPGHTLSLFSHPAASPLLISFVVGAAVASAKRQHSQFNYIVAEVYHRLLISSARLGAATNTTRPLQSTALYNLYDDHRTSNSKYWLLATFPPHPNAPQAFQWFLRLAFTAP